MSRRRKNRKNTSPGLGPEQMATAVAQAIADELEPIKKKLEDIEGRMDGQNSGLAIDEATLEEVGLASPQELETMLEDAANLAADNLEEGGDALAAAVIDAGLDTAEVVDELIKKRKSRKSAGEELAPVTVEEVAEAIEEVAEEIADDMSAEEIEELAGDGFLDAKDAEEEGAKRRKSAGKPYVSKKSATRPANQRKPADTPSVHRKYADIYTNRKSSQQPNQKKMDPVAAFGRAVKCSDYFAQGGALGSFKDPERAAYAAKKYYNDDRLARQFKAMSVTEPSSGGFLVPQDYVDDIIPMLYNQTVIFELGAQKVPMPHGNLNMPKQTSGSRAYFGGEARPIEASQPTMGLLHLSSKRLQAMVPMTEELMRSTEYSADRMFGNDLLERMKGGIEHGALLGPGTQFAPLGLYNNPGVEKVNLRIINDNQIADAQGRPTADLPLFLRGKVLAKNVQGAKFGWTFNSEMEQYLMRMKSTDGKFIWLEQMEKGLFCMAPYRTTNWIPTNEATGTTSMIFGEWGDLIVAEQFGLETRTSYDASYTTSQGMQSAFETVQTITRATCYIDIGCRHEESFVIATNVKVRG